MSKCIYQVLKGEKYDEFQRVGLVVHKVVNGVSDEPRSREAMQVAKTEPCITTLCVPLNAFAFALLKQMERTLWYYQFKNFKS